MEQAMVCPEGFGNQKETSKSIKKLIGSLQFLVVETNVSVGLCLWANTPYAPGSRLFIKLRLQPAVKTN